MAQNASSASLAFVTFDVFTSTKFVGNPLAIIHLPPNLSPGLTQGQKQIIAREFNLSEIVFLHEPGSDQTGHDGKPLQQGDLKIDIFTSQAEVPFAGHPTIGTSNYVLRYLQRSNDASIKNKFASVKALVCKAGRLPITVQAEIPGSKGVEGARLNVAHNVRVHAARLTNAGTLDTLPQGVRDEFTTAELESFRFVSGVKGMTFILAKLANLEDLGRRPKESLIGAAAKYKSTRLLDEGWQVGLIATYFYVDLGREEGFEGRAGVRKLRTRMIGSFEDPATGSAASALCAYLAIEEGVGQGRDRVKDFFITQGVEMGRKSEISVEVTVKEDGSGVESLVLRGTAIKAMQGFVDIPDPDVASTLRAY